MNIETAILKAIQKSGSGSAGFGTIYESVVTHCGPYAHEVVREKLKQLCSVGTILKLATEKWVLANGGAK